jgi:predicted alpha/beta superfamily hydrolase
MHSKIKTLVCLLVLLSAVVFGQNKKTITLGIVDEISSAQLSEKRMLNIYLPDDYSDSVNKKYDVIYLLDGGVDEDFIHFCGLVQYNTFPWVNGMPKSIVVGVVNVDRKRDMTFPTTVKKDKEKWPTTGGSEKFMAFLEKDLMPYIQKNYRTNGNKTLIGESLGGLFTTEVLLKKPTLFNNYLIISPSLWWDNGSLLNYKPVLSSVVPSTKTRVYIAVGKEGLAPSEQPHVMEVDANVMVEKIQELNNKNIDLHFDFFPEYDHATIGYRALYEGFRKMYVHKQN